MSAGLGTARWTTSLKVLSYGCDSAHGGRRTAAGRVDGAGASGFERHSPHGHRGDRRGNTERSAWWSSATGHREGRDMKDTSSRSEMEHYLVLARAPGERFGPLQ